MVLEHEHWRRYRAEPAVAENRPLCTLDIDLREVGAVEESHDVDCRHAFSPLLDP